MKEFFSAGCAALLGTLSYDVLFLIKLVNHMCFVFIVKQPTLVPYTRSVSVICKHVLILITCRKYTKHSYFWSLHAEHLVSILSGSTGLRSVPSSFTPYALPSISLCLWNLRFSVVARLLKWLQRWLNKEGCEDFHFQSVNWSKMPHSSAWLEFIHQLRLITESASSLHTSDANKEQHLHFLSCKVLNTYQSKSLTETQMLSVHGVFMGSLGFSAHSLAFYIRISRWSFPNWWASELHVWWGCSF